MESLLGLRASLAGDLGAILVVPTCVSASLSRSTIAGKLGTGVALQHWGGRGGEGRGGGVREENTGKRRMNRLSLVICSYLSTM